VFLYQLYASVIHLGVLGETVEILVGHASRQTLQHLLQARQALKIMVFAEELSLIDEAVRQYHVMVAGEPGLFQKPR